VGKTRLAVKVAGEQARAFADGVFLADLSAARDPGTVAGTVAAVLGLPGPAGQPNEPPPGRIAGQLRGRRLLLILDTCEHVAGACAALADAVLCAGDGPALLVTSRQPLSLPAEAVFRIDPLTADDAVSLLADRAGAAVTGFAVTADTRRKLARLGQLLDGNPLAIELAALRLRAVGLDELLTRLPGRLRLLGSGRPGAGDRGQSLQASVGWSYDLCSPAERLLWARLSVFDGSFDLAAAEKAGPGDGLGAREIPDTLAGLVDKSVVLRAPDTGGVTRYRLPALAREHGTAVRGQAVTRSAAPLIPASRPVVPEPAMPRASEPRASEPRASEPRAPEPRAPEPRAAVPAPRRFSPAGQAPAPRRPAAAGRPGGRTGLDDTGLDDTGLDDAAFAGCWARLTAREREVAALVALGLTSKDIAARLVVSKRTVDSHLEHILGKLGYNSRLQVAALVAYEQARPGRVSAAGPRGDHVE
jgi:DNA-binding CsgD family transcriptional regulator